MVESVRRGQDCDLTESYFSWGDDAPDERAVYDLGPDEYHGFFRSGGWMHFGPACRWRVSAWIDSFRVRAEIKKSCAGG